MSMDDKGLLQLLNAHEWNDVEFKQARQAIPKNAYESVSAFANTEGGHLVFGVKKDDSNFEVTEHLKAHFLKSQTVSVSRGSDQVSVDVNTDLPTPSDQVDDKIKPSVIPSVIQTIKLTDKQRIILKKCEVLRSMAELQEILNYRNRSYFKKKIVNPLIESGLVQMTKPEKPNASDQKYVITANGSRLVQSWRDAK